MAAQLAKTLIKHGNSLALVIDKPILEMLQIDANTKLKLTTNGDALLIQPERSAESQQQLLNAIKSINEQHADDLKRLAE